MENIEYIWEDSNIRALKAKEVDMESVKELGRRLNRDDAFEGLG